MDSFCAAPRLTSGSLFNRLRRSGAAFAAAALLLLGIAGPASAAAFTPGNLAVYRVGAVGAPAALTSAATAVFVDEYTTAGVLVQTIALPTADNGAQQMLTGAGSSTSDGLMTRSIDGQYLVLTGFDAAVGTSGVAATNASTVSRVVGRIDSAGNVDTSTVLGTAFSTGNPRGVASLDGTAFWVSGSNSGIVYATLGATSNTSISTTSANNRAVEIFGGQLYISTSSGSIRLASVGTGTPTTSGQTATNLPGFATATTSPHQFFFADLDTNVAGLDTVYVTDDRAPASSGGLQKWTYNGTTWTQQGTLSTGLSNGLRGLTGVVSGSNVTLYAVDAAGTGRLVTATDTSGAGATINGTFSTLATASTNTTFRSVALVPVAAGSTAPTVSSINRVGSALTNAATVDFTVTFSESVTGVDATDFTVTSTTTGASVTNVSGSGSTYTVTVNTGTGDGTVRLDLIDNDSIVNGTSTPLGGAGTGNGNFTTGQVYTIDKTSPAVQSVTRVQANPTSLSSVDFTVTFDGAVTGVDTSDFSVTTTGAISGALVTNVSGSGATYTVSVNTGSGATGTVRLDVNNGASITDAAGNLLASGFNSGETYTIDRNAPSVTSVVRANASPTNASSVNYTVTFSQSVTGVDSGDFTLTTTGVTGASITNVSGSGTTYTVTVSTGSGDGTIRLDVVANGTILGPTSVPLGSGYTSGEVYAVDKTAPTVQSSVRASANPTAAASVTFTVTFNEAVTGVSTSNFTLTTTGVTGASVTNVSGSGTTYTVTVSTGSGDGTIRLDVGTGGAVVDAAGNAFATAFTSGETYTVSKSAPSAGLVISQVYGGNGNAYSNDYIELFNSTGATINIGGYSVQYGSATGQFGSVATNIYTFPSGTTIGAGRYLSVKFGTAGSGLPTTTDLDGGATSLNMSGTSGKVALVINGTALGCGATATPCTYPDPRIVDVVSYGASNNGEGGTTVNGGTAISASSGPLRKSEGCQDTDNNNADFIVATTATGLAPRTASTPQHICPPVDHAPTITAPADPIATVNENAAPFTVSLSGNDDNSIYNWSATPGTGVSSVNVTAGQGTNSVTYTVTLQTNFYGTAAFTASLSDGVNPPTTRVVHIQVDRDVNINHPPTINAPANPITTVAQNATPFNVSLTGSDDNNAYAWSATTGNGVSSVIVSAGQGTANVTFNVTLQSGFIGTAQFTASLSDGVNPPTTQVVNIGVSPNGSTVGHVVISQLYGAGGNSGALYSNDYVELYNPTGNPVNLAGWTLQYASSTNTGVWGSIAPLGGIIGPGEYFLVGLASGGDAGSALPTTPNISGDINISASAGKVALVSNGDALNGACAQLILDADIVDFVGYGAANCSEGNNPAAQPATASTALFRASNGDVDTNNNGNDFSGGTANPRRTSPIQEIGPAVVNTDPNNGNTIAPRDANIVITFTEAVTVTGNWFDITCATTGAHNSATVAQSGTRAWTIIPNVNFVAGEQCTVTLFKDFIHDTDTDDSTPGTDTLAANYTWSFTVASGTAPPYPSSVHLTMGNPSNAVEDLNTPNNYLMQKPEMAISYNRDKGSPNWVSWHLSDEWVGSLTRNDTFRADPAVPPTWYRVLGSDFQGSGFDRGHMTPNADRDKETSTPINQATFLMSNMVAQAPDNNQGPWANMENDLRALLPANELYIVSGPAGVGGTGSNGSATTIANGHVTVPASTWKVVLVLPKASGDDVARVTAATRTIAVNMPNVQGIRNDDWHNYITTVDAIETLTGYDFFANVPDAIENAIEAGTNGTNPPGAASQSVTTNEDVAKSITLSAVSPTGASLTYTIVTTPTHGNLTGTGDTRTYTPAPDYNGSDTFTWRANDGSGNSNTATVTITIREVNDPPTASDDNAGSTNANTPLTFAASTLTTNDSAGPANEAGQTLTVSSVTATANTHGTVVLNSGQITYTPASNYSGPASFSYSVCDNGTTAGSSNPLCATGTVFVTVSSVSVITPRKPDMNADGKSDIVLQNSNTSAVASWLMNEGTIMEGKVVATPGADQQIVATGDLNGDGKTDILVKNSSTGAISVWLMDGTTRMSDTVITIPNSAWRVVGTR
ncbi:MAG: DNA/RNA non-specific endonuclease, partial [Acidobacteria bacterium]|nr:DNA/RNA non-specific endonuclease [Acidobacteriota bacterium]